MHYNEPMDAQHSRLRLLIENLFAYGSMQVIMKLIPLVMLPFVTRLLTDTADFARYDLYNTVHELGVGLALLGVSDALFREYFERDDLVYRKKATSTAFLIVLASSVVVAGLIALLRRPLSLLFFGSQSAENIILLAALATLMQANETLAITMTRMENRRLLNVLAGVANSLLFYLFAIFLLHRGFGYYSLIFGMLMILFLLVIFYVGANRKNISFRLYDRNVAKELLRVGLPLLPMFLIYWVFHSMDKIMITHMLGLSEAGIYSTGAKVAQVAQIVYTAFTAGWQYFAFFTMRDEDQVAMTSRVFEYLGLLSFAALFFVSLFDQWLFGFLFTGNYALGYMVFPYLFLSPLLLTLFQTASNQFLIVKKTYLTTLCLSLGVVCNLVLNYFGIRLFGIRGAALATLTGYTVSLIMIAILTVKMRLLTVNKKLLLLFAMSGAFVILRFTSERIVYSIAAIFGLLLCLALYGKELLALLKTLPEKLRPRA